MTVEDGGLENNKTGMRHRKSISCTSVAGSEKAQNSGNGNENEGIFRGE